VPQFVSSDLAQSRAKGKLLPLNWPVLRAAHNADVDNSIVRGLPVRTGGNVSTHLRIEVYSWCSADRSNVDVHSSDATYVKLQSYFRSEETLQCRFDALL